MLKPFRRPPLWLGLWVAAVAAVVVGSLVSPPPTPDVPDGDKGLHLVAYVAVAVVTVQVFRRWGWLLSAAAFLVVLGAGLEVAQGTLTEDRVLDWRDAAANAAGVALGLGSGALPGRDTLLVLDRRWRRPSEGRERDRS
ncbi:hypothetical protein [Nocardioides sp. SYSU DS0651]|uniref:hypothetical protein n=1 Tax=Nocardioides sp. SYSU DS0651 TaxID=3415955 RepID=UPI003F4B88A0